MKKTLISISLVLVFVLAIALPLSGCSASNASGSAVSMAANRYGGQMALYDSTGKAAYDFSLADTVTPTATAQAANEPGRQIITTGSVSLETKTFDKTNSDILAEINSEGGYVASSNYNGASLIVQMSQNRSANITARVPADKYNDFVTALAAFGNVTNQSASTTDVTMEYDDMTARIDSLTIQQGRLTELLKQAATVDDLLRIENALTDVRAQLQSLSSQKAQYDNQISYATVYVNLAEVSDLTVTSGKGFLNQMWNAFIRSLHSLGRAGQGLVYGIIFLIPYAVILAVVIFVLVLIVKSVKKKRNAKKLKATAEHQAE